MCKDNVEKSIQKSSGSMGEVTRMEQENKKTWQEIMEAIYLLFIQLLTMNY